MNNYQNDRDTKTDVNSSASGTIPHLLAAINNLPTLPEINLKLIRACNSGRENIHELARLIKMDPALSLKVVDMYYSGFHEYPKRLVNLDDALNRIGIDAIRNIISCSSAGSILEAQVNERRFDLMHFWSHSLKCAFVAKAISKEIPNQSPADAFLAGLLHDIGKMILFTSLPNIYGRIMSDKTDQSSFILREKKTIGMDHCYLGYRLVDRWQYNAFTADAILYHHHPLEKVAVAHPLVKILYLANLIAGQGTEDNEAIFNAASTLFDFSHHKTEEYLLYAETKLDDAARLFEIQDLSSERIQASVNVRNNARLNLADEVRNASLVAYTMQNILWAKDKASVLRIIRQGFQILFGKSDIFFFLYDRHEKALVGHCTKEDELSMLIEGLRISDSFDKSIMVSCLRDRSHLDSFSFQKRSEMAIIDLQLIHFAGKEGILCLPMTAGDEPVGVIVLGVEKAEYSFLLKQINLLNSFARQCAPAFLDKKEAVKETKPSEVSSGVVFARKIIHEINNPLSVIRNYLKVLGMKLADQDIQHDEIRIINDEISRIVKMLKKFSASQDRGNRMVREPVNVNALLLDIIKLTRGSLEERIGIDISLDSDTSIQDIITEKDNLKQVFMNLLKNSIEAMPGGGKILIKTSYVPSREKDEVRDGAGIQGRAVRIVIKDDGPGISEEIRSKIFNEFVSSKEGHEGLGLSIVKGIISRLNGSIICESPKGEGTSFIIDLPMRIVS